LKIKSIVYKDLENSIAASKLQGETLVEKSIEEGRFNASKEADKIMGEAEKKSQTISIQLDQQTIKKIIEIFLSGM
jgi:vacuolar-type H+-ATPase subunit H